QQDINAHLQFLSSHNTDSMDREYTKFVFQYAKDYPEKTENDAYAAYMASKQ
ncbi:8874_t:CDS:1, partial [Ambispora leptoticha]